MATTMTTRSHATVIKDALMDAVGVLESHGFSRAQVGAAMIGVGAGLTAANAGSQNGLDVLSAARDAIEIDRAGRN